MTYASNFARIASMSMALTLVACASSLAYAQGGTVNQSADAQNIDSACAQDAATANCGNEKVGTGLMKCLHQYKKANPSFKISEQCHAAMKKGRMDHMGKHPAPTQSSQQ